MYMRLLEPDQISHMKKSFKTQHGRIPIDPAILAAVGHHFIAKNKRQNKNAGTRV